MVNAELVFTVAERIAPGGRIFVQTDIEFLAKEMYTLFKAEHALSEVKIEKNPFPVKTEREKAVESRNLPVFRMLFEKN